MDMKTVVAELRASASEMERGEERNKLIRLAKRLSKAQYGFGLPPIMEGQFGTEPVPPQPKQQPPVDDEEAVPQYDGTPGGITDPNRAPRQYWSMEFVNFPAMTYEEAVKVGAEIQDMIKQKGGLESVFFSGQPKAMKTDDPTRK